MSNEHKTVLEQTTLTKEAWETLVRDFEASKARRETETIKETVAHTQVRSMFEIPALSPEHQSRWDAWADARITAIVEEAMSALGGHIGDEFGKLEKQFGEQVTKLKSENLKLRKEITLLKKSHERSANIVDLPNPIQRRS